MKYYWLFYLVNCDGFTMYGWITSTYFISLVWEQQENSFWYCLLMTEYFPRFSVPLFFLERKASLFSKIQFEIEKKTIDPFYEKSAYSDYRRMLFLSFSKSKWMSLSVLPLHVTLGLRPKVTAFIINHFSGF